MTDYFTITRTLQAPRELVFEAITTPEHFAVWFGTAAVDVPQDTPHHGRASRRRVRGRDAPARRQPHQLVGSVPSPSNRPHTWP